ncbi:MAG: uridine kinase [Myxococcota bacterium]
MIVGIGGGSASGKTTLARRLAQRLGAALLLHDRYYRDAPEPHRVNFDHPDALETERLVTDLDALRAGREVDLPVYDFATHRRAAWTDRLAPGPVIVVEGILVLADAELRQRFDVRAFVHAPADLRLARRIVRDTNERGRTVESVLAQYLDQVRPMHERWVEPSRAHAEIELDGAGDLDAELERLVTFLSSRG